MENLIAELDELLRRFAGGPQAETLGFNLVGQAIMALKAREVDPVTSFELDLLADILTGRDRAADVELLRRASRCLLEPTETLPASYRRTLRDRTR